MFFLHEIKAFRIQILSICWFRMTIGSVGSFRGLIFLFQNCKSIFSFVPSSSAYTLQSSEEIPHGNSNCDDLSYTQWSLIFWINLQRMMSAIQVLPLSIRKVNVNTVIWENTCTNFNKNISSLATHTNAAKFFIINSVFLYIGMDK
jgi:hypothetical protein